MVRVGWRVSFCLVFGGFSCLLDSWTVRGTGIHVEILDYESLFITRMFIWRARLGWVRLGLVCYLADWLLGAVEDFVADVIGLVSCIIFTPKHGFGGPGCR